MASLSLMPILAQSLSVLGLALFSWPRGGAAAPSTSLSMVMGAALAAVGLTLGGLSSGMLVGVAVPAAAVALAMSLAGSPTEGTDGRRQMICLGLLGLLLGAALLPVVRLVVEHAAQTAKAAGATAAQGASPDDLAATFSNLRDSDPRVAETFKDVAPEDMKAAVMLLGMSQLRDSLARDNTSFEQDLQLLKTTLAKDNPELLASIDRLAPKAKSGVLTPTGLSNELRGLTGDIVSASLSGQDVSITDKAVARLGTMITVEKNGQQISGTSTQIVIAQAQKKLDAGDVAGAVALLQQIQGPAAAKTQPLIDQAQATMLASHVQHLLGQNLVQTLKNMTHKSAPYTVGNDGVNQILDTVKSVGSSAIGGQ